MPKVLLYEPGDSGHRPVILRYLTQGLPSFGWEPVVVCEKAYQRLRDQDIAELEECALARGCSLIHLLTIDGHVRGWLTPRRRSSCHSAVPKVGTYYLFNNLWGVRGICWSFAKQFKYIDRLLVSDLFIGQRLLIPSVRDMTGFIPDPWSRKEFKVWSQADARRLLGLDSRKYLVLVFGEISRRKGLPRIIEALRHVDAEHISIVLAGRVASDVKELVERAQGFGQAAPALIVHDRYIAEEMVSAYFYAADAVLSDYPLSFQVSSGVFTRALAAGRLPIFPNHGVNAQVMRKLGFGISYKSEDVTAMAAAINLARKASSLFPPAAASESDARELKIYVKKVVENYRTVLQ